MLVRDLIKMLQDLEEQHKPHEDIMGPCVIMFDYYDDVSNKENEEPSSYVFGGLVTDAIIEYTPDGVYPVLTAKYTPE